MLSSTRANSLIPVRIGTLLISAGILRSDYMANALMVARQSGRKVGEVLVTSNLLTAEDLRVALDLQSLMKNGNITVEMGIKALKVARAKKLDARDALMELGFSSGKNISTIDLATILLEAKCLTREQIDQASWNAARNKLTIGRNLVLNGAVSPSILGYALNVLVLLRDKKVTIEHAIQTLTTAAQKKCSVEEVLQLQQPISANHVRIGELLSTAGLLSESDAMTAVEKGLLNQLSMGQILLDTQMVSPLVLEAALKLQKYIENGEMSRTQATELIRQVASKQVGLENFLSEMVSLKSRVLELLLASQVVSNYQVQQAVNESPELESDLLRALFTHGVVTQDLFRSAVRCVYAIDAGTYSVEESCHWLRQTFLAPLEAQPA